MHYDEVQNTLHTNNSVFILLQNVQTLHYIID